ncbi:ABC transporter permease [Vibrio mediterranei]|uniref:ABC transporter permease n=1 Tax=Vibrio mediterranei TaxID=689 RepID=A0ABX5DD44_9VIBR|nr:ABC transporter permease [Vibrio mediterranei]MCG9660428.1 ABC transporter permease [Vibrio mediterranei]MCG9661473.1 ABC transporter permease [Vibrio mediterranei]PCD86474.1 ABC transporter permease [Vibrio mediterranei]PRQ66566.1 ABC transporter permease [Vibrio mediterranei]PTC03957.1 ABC transporter permease [Vibrio mediterranei]
MPHSFPTLAKRRLAKSQFHSQWQVLRHDKWLLSCLSWVPILLCLSIYWIFSQGIASNLPIGVVDLSKSQLSQKLVRNYDATSMLSVNHQYDDIGQARDALIEGDIYAILTIPHGFDKAVVKSLRPEVTLFYNSQYILVGRLINSAALQAQGTFNAQVEVVKALAKGNTTGAAAMGKAVNVRTQITPLFNKGTNYAQFLVSAIVPAIWQIAVVSFTVLVLSANYRISGLAPWLGQEKPISRLAQTLFPYFLWFLLQGTFFLVWFYDLIGWPMEGSWLVLFFAQIVTTITCMIMAALFFFLTCDAARAMSFAGAFTAPSFAFMGITFPATDMNPLALFWRELLPISHYIEVQVSQASYGVTPLQSLSHLTPMLGYVIPLVVTSVLIKKHMSKELVA